MKTILGKLDQQYLTNLHRSSYPTSKSISMAVAYAERFDPVIEHIRDHREVRFKLYGQMDHTGAVSMSLRRLGLVDHESVAESAAGPVLLTYLHACDLVLHQLEQTLHADTLRYGSEHFRAAVNRIVAADRLPMRLTPDRWRPTVDSDREALLRLMLATDDDVAEFRQGDVQVEMVASTVLDKLAKDGATLVDYGVGLGRFLHGMRGTPRFRQAAYVGVDEPITDEVRAVASSLGGSTTFTGREAYLERPVSADVVLLVNTLHHIPFEDLARQLAALISSLRPGGLLLLHEMGVLPIPEKLNVPWRVEHIQALLDAPGLTLNLRTTVSRSGIPLTHALVSATDVGELRTRLESNARRVWERMKADTLSDIRTLYDEADAESWRQLLQALTTNANLDLNRP